MRRRDFIRWTSTAAAGLVVGRIAAEEKAEKRALAVRPIGTDRFELTFSPEQPRPVRILQITDTHFGRFKAGHRELDAKTRQTITGLIEAHHPDLIIHTGDFVSNDTDFVNWDVVKFMDGLGLPWAHALGNHDRGSAIASWTTEKYRQSQRNVLFGYFDRNGRREYATRLDFVAAGATQPGYTVFCFDSGYQEGSKHISDAQLTWFTEQSEADARANRLTPALAMMHIPILEYKKLAASGKFTGRAGEEVCRETDAGQTFKAFKASGRVRAVFVGHDHDNDYCGMWDGIELVYGRVTGWPAYGQGQRGGRLIELDLTAGTYRHRVVFPAGVKA